MNAPLYVRKKYPDAKLPNRAYEDSAGLDLYAYCPDGNEIVQPKTVHPIGVGLSVALPRGTVGLIFARSSLPLRYNLQLANGVGVIDSDYRGPIVASLRNFGSCPVEVPHGEKIIQMIIVPYDMLSGGRVMEVEELPDSERGEGGFGSSDKEDEQ